jgi:hypothetical protein
MSLANRVSRLEGGDGLCPRCGKPKPIEFIELIIPSDVAGVMQFATDAERATLDRVTRAIRDRAASEANA